MALLLAAVLFTVIPESIRSNGRRDREIERRRLEKLAGPPPASTASPSTNDPPDRKNPAPKRVLIPTLLLNSAARPTVKKMNQKHRSDFVSKAKRAWGWMALFGLLTLAHPTLQAADETLADQVKGLFQGVREHKLPNGLHVVLLPMRASSTVTLMVMYKVGACDEDKTATGLSHYLEHLMFKGTDKLFPGDIDRATLRNGGANNAWTSEDLTCYYFDFAADRWETALKIESDRMANLRIDPKHEFQQEKGAVIEELKRNEDQPWELESKALLPILFGTKSPYGHPVIGRNLMSAAPTPRSSSTITNAGITPTTPLSWSPAPFSPMKR